MLILETKGLRKSYNSNKGVVEAVKGVDLKVEKGLIFGFLGPNGAGKSTTLRMLTTLSQPSGGEAKVVGYDLLRQPAEVRKRIGYVSQAGGCDASSTGRENIVLQGRLYGLDKASANKRAEELISALALDMFADRLARTYSGGQRRRLDIAMGMVNRPDLLFLDEPTTGLDPQNRMRLWDEVRKLRDYGTTVFLTTHYLDEADLLCDRLSIIDHGRIVVEGTPTELKRRIAGDIITIGLATDNNDIARGQQLLEGQSFVREMHTTEEGLRLYVDYGEEVLPHVLRLYDGANLTIRTIAMARPTLDDVFLRQTGRSLREAENTPAAEAQNETEKVAR